MESADWLLLVNKDGILEAVEGGAPLRWVHRRVDACPELPESVRRAARGLVQELSAPAASALVRRVRVDPEGPGAPSFTLLAVEAIFLRPAEVAFESLLRGALEPLLRQAESAGVSLRIESTGDFPDRLSIDADKVTWSVTTLVGNALRYVLRGDGGAVPGGNVIVRLAHAHGASRMVSVTVEDDGPGIPASVRPWLLTPHPETGRTAGVSLRLIQEIMTAHGGAMIVKSSTAPEERGTVITLWLPVHV
jgi:signal transduction histidine kinase